jgi:hypothetical protein
MANHKYLCRNKFISVPRENKRLHGVPHTLTSEYIKIILHRYLLATIAGPVLAVQAQKFVERVRKTRQRKLRLFYTLMATRAARVSPEHVQALNMIDMEFYGRKVFCFRFQNSKEKALVESWRIYQDHLNHLAQDAAQDAIQVWSARGDELFTELLYKMSLALGYDFDQVQLKRGIYYPRAHGEQENAQMIIRDSLVKILSGEKPLPMSVTSFPTLQEALERQYQVQDALLEYLSGQRSLKVTIESEGGLGTNKTLNADAPPERRFD